jgi:hypothetical protein
MRANGGRVDFMHNTGTIEDSDDDERNREQGPNPRNLGRRKPILLEHLMNVHKRAGNLALEQSPQNFSSAVATVPLLLNLLIGWAHSNQKAG